MKYDDEEDPVCLPHKDVIPLVCVLSHHRVYRLTPSLYTPQLAAANYV